MIIFITVVIASVCSTAYLARQLTHRNRRDRSPAPGGSTGLLLQDNMMPGGSHAAGMRWTALDDLQLTRLLTESAQRTDPE